MKTRAANGFTLIEMMVGVAVLGILLSVAIPAFNGMSDVNRVTASTNQFITALATTRSKATSGGDQPVTICPANAALTACVDSTDWSTGWIVFIDNGTTPGVIESGESIIQTWPAMSGISIAQVSTSHFVRYEYSGRPVNTVPSKFDISKAVTNTYPRCVRVADKGEVTLKKAICP